MKKILYASLLCVSMFSCTSDFEKIDTDKSGISSGVIGEEDLDPSINYLTMAQRAIYPDNSNPFPAAAWVLQVQSNLNIDIWAGYLCSGTNFNGGYNNQTYDLVDGWNSYMLSNWNSIMTQVFFMKKSYESSLKSEQDNAALAMGIITQVLASERTVDMYGAIPYSSFGESLPFYNGAEEVYSLFFKQLDEAQELLLKSEDLNSGDQAKDIFYNGRIDGWKRLSNSLRLRLAMRIVKVSPQLAKSEAEKAMSHSFGLIDNNENATRLRGSFLNGLCVLAQDWGDTRMSADMESILVGYNDPRLPKFFSKKDGQYRGIRLGSDFSANSGPLYSSLGDAFPQGATYETAPIFLFTSAETFFLKAEAALRGYAGAGDVKTNYENGIELSMRQFGITDESSISSYKTSSMKPANWVSLNQKVATNQQAICKISPAFSEATDNESKLEKIITQKWIAMFPGGSSVAWSEYRRTGYPRLFPAYKAYFTPTINVVYGPKVVNNARKAGIPQSEYQINNVLVKEAVDKYLGGKDDIGTHVWWDVDVPNI